MVGCRYVVLLVKTKKTIECWELIKKQGLVVRIHSQVAGTGGVADEKGASEVARASNLKAALEKDSDGQGRQAKRIKRL